jgi:membrane protein implicated in regulation of membrane protease activity
MLKYIPGMLGAIAAMVVFRLLSMFDLSVRFVVFFVVYLVVTIAIDKAMTRYGRR